MHRSRIIRFACFAVPCVASAILASAVQAAAPAAVPPVSYFPNVNAAFTLTEAGSSSQFIKFIGSGLLNISSCAEISAAWRNASAPAERCLAATHFRAPRNASFINQCYCLVNPKWIPVASPETDSARLLWPCASAADCSYNGDCSSNGTCACDTAWSGPRCSELRLLPVDAAAPGLRLTDSAGRNVSTWGAPMLRDEATGVWHAWASEMEEGCGINSWTTNSHVVHATAMAPGGPWHREEELFPAFAHEPDVVRGPSGELVMVLSAYELPDNTSKRCTTCANGMTLAQDVKNGCGPNRTHSFKTVLAIARDGFDGRWDSLQEIVGLSTAWDWNTALTVLSNGSSVALLRACFVWTASNYADNTTWRSVGGDHEGPALGDANVEDPYIWVDRRGVFHAVMHSMDAGQPFCGGHAFSADGIAWTYTGYAYSNAANYSDGSWEVFARRERPHLLFAQDGTTPIALSNGVQYAAPPDVSCTIGGARTVCDPIFTLVQPIAT